MTVSVFVLACCAVADVDVELVFARSTAASSFATSELSFLSFFTLFFTGNFALKILLLSWSFFLESFKISSVIG